MFMKPHTGLASIGACSDYTVSKYARLDCAISLQKIFNLDESVWTFATAIDMSSHTNKSFCCIHIHLYHMNGGLINVHVLAISILKKHTNERIFELYCNVLDVLCLVRTKTIPWILSDGERKMTS